MDSSLQENDKAAVVHGISSTDGRRTAEKDSYERSACRDASLPTPLRTILRLNDMVPRIRSGPLTRRAKNVWPRTLRHMGAGPHDHR
jgi:hypothetical protein